MMWFIGFFTLSGLTLTFWACIGILRGIEELLFPQREISTQKKIDVVFDSKNQIDWKDIDITKSTIRQANNGEVTVSIDLEKTSLEKINVQYGLQQHAITVDDVAVIIAAHNEEITIANTLITLKRMIPAEQIFVGSDSSTDRTIEIVKKHEVNVVDINPNKGKAGVLALLLEHFQLLDRFKAVMIVDADIAVDSDFLKYALPYFDDLAVGALAGHFNCYWKNHWIPTWAQFFNAYRVRLYRVLQSTMRYGQTWSKTNVTIILPGSTSLYRSSALRHINITAPGLVIEDFNMTFEMHHKKLGKIAYTNKCFSKTENPHTLRDFMKQVKRWNLGFWQTLKIHGLWPSFFVLSIVIFNIEMILYGLGLLIMPLLILWLALNSFEPLTVPLYFANVDIRMIDIVFGLFLVDYCVTIAVAIYERKPMMLLYGLGFIFLRYLDNVLYLYSIPLTFLVKSDGKWVSPKRKIIEDSDPRFDSKALDTTLQTG